MEGSGIDTSQLLSSPLDEDLYANAQFRSRSKCVNRETDLTDQNETGLKCIDICLHDRQHNRFKIAVAPAELACIRPTFKI
jgi:hypothetical protein